VHNQARGSAIGASFETEPSASHLHEEDSLALGKHLKRRSGDGLTADRSNLCEETVAAAHDFENAVRQLIPPRVAIQEPGIQGNPSVVFRRIEIRKRRPGVQQMNSNVIDPAQSEGVRERNYSDTRFRVVSDERSEASGPSVMPDALSKNIPPQTISNPVLPTGRRTSSMAFMAGARGVSL